MKHLIVLACIVTTLVAAPCARAGLDFNTDYQGRIEGDPNTWFGFDVDRVNGHRKVRNLTFDAPLNCRKSGFQDYLAAQVEGAFRIRHHRFHGTGDLHTMGTGDATVKGRFRTEGRARGTLDVNYVDGDPDDTCYSGLLNWRARRGATVPPPF